MTAPNQICRQCGYQTGEPVFQGRYEIRTSTKVQDIFDMEEIR